MSPDQLVSSAINGLRPNIRQQVLTHEPKTLEDIRRWALVAEAAGGQDEVTAILKRMDEKFSRLQVGQVEVSRPRSPSPAAREAPARGVHFERRGNGQPQFRNRATSAGVVSSRPNGEGRPASREVINCGGVWHLMSTCPARGVRYNYCHKLNHFRSVC